MRRFEVDLRSVLLPSFKSAMQQTAWGFSHVQQDIVRCVCGRSCDACRRVGCARKRLAGGLGRKPSMASTCRLSLTILSALAAKDGVPRLSLTGNVTLRGGAFSAPHKIGGRRRGGYPAGPIYELSPRRCRLRFATRDGVCASRRVDCCGDLSTRRGLKVLAWDWAEVRRRIAIPQIRLAQRARIIRCKSRHSEAPCRA
jgi:hypothetical protein